jgi:hypothetical protein
MKSWMASTSVSRSGRLDRRVLFDEQRAHEAAAEIGEGEPLRLEIAFGLGAPYDEVDEGLVGAAAIDRERRDPGADDDGEREEALADDLAQGVEAADSFADALEPTVGAERVEGKLFFGLGHDGTPEQPLTSHGFRLEVHRLAVRVSRIRSGHVPARAAGRAFAADRANEALAAARLHAQMTERKVVFRRVFRVEPGERGRDLAHGAVARVLARRKAEVSPELEDVRVDRAREQTPRDAAPDAEVDAVLRPHHPPKEEMKTLRAGPGAHVGQEMRRTSAAIGARPREAALVAQVVDEPRERLPRLVRAGAVDAAFEPREEERLEAPEAELASPRPVEEAGHVLSTKEAVHEPLEPTLEPRQTARRPRAGSGRGPRAPRAPWPR